MRTVALVLMFLVLLGRQSVLAEPSHLECTGLDCVTRSAAATQAGFLVVAADRGFSGNEVIRDAFASLPNSHNAELVFVTDQRSKPYVTRALRTLTDRGADKIVVLPLFLSRAHPRLVLVRDLVEHMADKATPVVYANEFGKSYLAVEWLVERLRAVEVTDDDTVLLAGYGAEDEASRQAMAVDLKRIAHWATRDIKVSRVEAVVWPEFKSDTRDAMEESAWKQVDGASGSAGNLRLLPFHLGRALDSMMSFDSYLERKRPPDTRFGKHLPGEGALLSLWLQREANRFTAEQAGRVGVVFLAHGADFNWNQTMRDAAQALKKKYALEFAFSMADPPTIERAIRRLEARDVGAIVIVRVFGLESSFRTPLERLIGRDVETPAHTHQHGQHGQHGMHGMHQPAPRLRTRAMVTTAGGLEDHSLFAQALLDRARELSSDPARETIILVAHGSGDDARNEHWGEVLASLASQMKSLGGMSFSNIHFQTWREDWPEKRESRIESVRRMVETATQDGGKAIVIPARTTGEGPAKEYLHGLDYQLGSGFVPNPLFGAWLEEQVKKGIERVHATVRVAQRADGHATTVASQ